MKNHWLDGKEIVGQHTDEIIGWMACYTYMFNDIKYESYEFHSIKSTWNCEEGVFGKYSSFVGYKTGLTENISMGAEQHAKLMCEYYMDKGWYGGQVVDTMIFPVYKPQVIIH